MKRPQPPQPPRGSDWEFNEEQSESFAEGRKRIAEAKRRADERSARPTESSRSND